MIDRLAGLLLAPKGFLAVSLGPSVQDAPDIQHARSVLGSASGADLEEGGLHVMFLGLESEDRFDAGAGGFSVLLSREPRSGDADLDSAAVERLLAPDGSGLGAMQDLLPPFGAVARAGRGAPLVAGVDCLGFRHLYFHQGRGWAAVSTSARAVAACSRSSLDRGALATQSLLGWQIGVRTPFSDIDKVPPGAIVVLDRGVAGLRKGPGREDVSPVRSLDAAVVDAARGLQAYMSSYLDDHPDAVLQLTGGQDSRILLAALAAPERRGLNVMTLAVPGSPDLPIAAVLARRYGLVHHVADLGGLDSLTVEQAHALVSATAQRLDCSADPLAQASLAWAESNLRHQRRLSGLGGEVARGFYYVGQAQSGTVNARRVDRLALWRLFANEAVVSEALDPEFAAWGRADTLRRLQERFMSYGPNWLDATDEFYLGERMHRWAGVLATGTCTERAVVNPMLDRRFLDLTRALPSTFKRDSRFLSRILCELDPELARIPLDGRPPPMVFARPSPVNKARLVAQAGLKTARKVRQRLFEARRPPAGGAMLADSLVEYWRKHPSSLDAVRSLDIFSTTWLDKLIDGAVDADPATAALLVNLEVATGDLVRTGPASPQRDD